MVELEFFSYNCTVLKRKRVALEDVKKALEIFSQIPITPLDVESLDLGITTREIVQFIREGRKTS